MIVCYKNHLVLSVILNQISKSGVIVFYWELHKFITRDSFDNYENEWWWCLFQPLFWKVSQTFFLLFLHQSFASDESDEFLKSLKANLEANTEQLLMTRYWKSTFYRLGLYLRQNFSSVKINFDKKWVVKEVDTFDA
jgi:hypothetical protein